MLFPHKKSFETCFIFRFTIQVTFKLATDFASCHIFSLFLFWQNDFLPKFCIFFPCLLFRNGLISNRIQCPNVYPTDRKRGCWIAKYCSSCITKKCFCNLVVLALSKNVCVSYQCDDLAFEKKWRHCRILHFKHQCRWDAIIYKFFSRLEEILTSSSINKQRECFNFKA